MSRKDHDKITRAKAILWVTNPFYSFLIAPCKFIEDKTIDTMCTNMVDIRYNPDFVDAMTVDETAAVICHEGLHIGFLHGLRLNFRDHEKWNRATDYAINLILEDSKLRLPDLTKIFKDKQQAPIPPGEDPRGILLKREYEGMNAEQIYRLLPDPPKQGGKGGKGQPGGGGGIPSIGDFEAPPPGENGQSQADHIDEIEANIKERIASAAQAAKSRGLLPGSLEGLIEVAGEPEVAWHNYIQQWVVSVHPDDYSWAKPHYAILEEYDIYIPTIIGRGCGTGVLNIDVSGSVSDEELTWFVNEIAGIIQMCKPDKLYIMQHDAVVQDVREWKWGESFKKLPVKGRGGTCIKPSFKKVEELGDVDWMINFTDMEIFDFPSAAEAPHFPVMWCATGKNKAPFGTHIRLKGGLRNA